MSEIDLSKYGSIVFDCDGVVLNSNKIKTEAFYEASKHYGHSFAQSLKEHHVQNGGISRYKKFEYFFTNILGKEVVKTEMDILLLKFENEVKQGLTACDVTEMLGVLRKKTFEANWLIVSGGDQAELRSVFEARGLAEYFDGGIFGSPDAKDIILSREISLNNINKPGLFIGDSKYDYQVAKAAGLDFLFVSSWSEVVLWQEWCDENGIIWLERVSDLL